MMRATIALSSSRTRSGTSHPRRVSSVSTATIEAPAWSRMRRGFVSPLKRWWQHRLTDHGRDFARCLLAIPGALVTGTVLAMMLGPIWQGIPA